MRPLKTLFAMLSISTALAATLSGAVNGADGKPVMGVFIIAQDARTKRTVSVLSNEQGRYVISDLPAGAYNVGVRAIGFKTDLRQDVALTSEQKTTLDFVAQKRSVQWGELTTYQGRKLLPKVEGHTLNHNDPFFGACFQSCHSFQNRMAQGANASRDVEGWRDRIKYMNDTMMAGEGRRTSDKEAEDFAQYLTVLFGPESPKPDSPEQMPDFKSLTRAFKPSAMNIAYVEFDMPASAGMGPWSAMEDRDGKMWIPYYGKGNEVIRLDPDTAQMTHFKLPFSRTAGIHSVIPAANGKVWFVETAMGKIAELDPATQEINEYQSPPLPDGKRAGAHTIRVDERGLVWTSGGPVITMFDPKTKDFRHFDVPATYGNTVGQNGDQWFTSFRADGVIARISKDGVLSKFQPPTNGKPQRLDLDKDGNVWFSERQGNKIGKLDPKTQAFQEFSLPGPEASPYAIGVSGDGGVWYSSHEQDTLNRLDPKTGEVMEYPYPHAEISMREFFLDSKGRMWYASSANNKIGYWYLADVAK